MSGGIRFVAEPVDVVCGRDLDGAPALVMDEEFERLEKPAAGGVRPWVARFILRMGGWRIGGAPPNLCKYVIVAAPHTAWMDGVWMLAFAWYWGINLAWIGKASLAKGPLGWLTRRVGLIPVDRSAAQGLVAQIVEQFDKRDSLFLSIPPEGTRGKGSYWKSGFYQIARGAGVPICLSYLDYGVREAGFGPMIKTSDNIVADMDRIRAFYKPEWARHPGLFTLPRLREESSIPMVSIEASNNLAVDLNGPLREVVQD